MNRLKQLRLRWIDTSWVDPSRAGRKKRRSRLALGVAALGLTTVALAPWTSVQVFAEALPGGTLDPATIQKYVTPLVIPPVMHRSETNGDIDRKFTDPTRSDYMPEDVEGRKGENYQIAVRQFQQQILPVPLPPTTVWSYGPAGDPTPLIAPDPNSQFNYPAYTIETRDSRRVNVRWINELVGAKTNPIDFKHQFLEHLLPVDQTLHWANPPGVCDPHNGSALTGTDCMGLDPLPYKGPVPIVTHVHGSHVDPASDGYPEAWWLPAAKYIPAGYTSHGRLFDDATGKNPGNLGYANFSYRNDQAATTLWYHDHALGMTRSNVYAGPAGFWLIRGGRFDGGRNVATNTRAILPGPAPRRGQGVLPLNTPGNPVRNAIREIPIAIQDRSFNQDGSLFYPSNRAFFEGLDQNQLQIPFAPTSDVAPIWNPEAFFNVMVVNGVSWPKLDVAQARYRFRLLNGTNARFLNLALTYVDANSIKKEIPFYQIGAEQGFLPQVVRIQTGEQVALIAGAPEPTPNPNLNDPKALLMGNAERADVIVDFSGLAAGTIVTMINTGPDGPFGGFPVDPVADPGTTGQVMQFVVNASLTGAKGSTDGKTTAPANLKLNAEQPLGPSTVTRLVSLNEESSKKVCVPSDGNGNFVLTDGNLVSVPCGDPTIDPFPVPFGPTAALLGTVSLQGSTTQGPPLTPATDVGNPLKWTDVSGASQPVKVRLNSGATITVDVTEKPKLGDTEEWQIYNFTVDGHPIHMHLVRFEVVSRACINISDPSVPGSGCATPHPLEPSEMGYKDTVIAYPGEITTVKAKFDIPGLYVWHCHIVEHEDNEMMRPYVVSAVAPPPHHHDFDDRDREHHKMKHEYRWAAKP